MGWTLLVIVTILPPVVCLSAVAGPLRVHRDNPRWMADGADHAVYLAGSHTWANRQERGLAGRTPDFDYGAYLEFLGGHGHNFMRLWAWEHACWMQFAGPEHRVRYMPLPYQRTGPGTARDGGEKFDVERFNEDYFRRLRRRVALAAEKGIYVAVMLFQGFSVEQKGTDEVDPDLGDPWQAHPFHADNNVNGIDGDPDGDGRGRHVHTLAVPVITRLQERYVRKTIQTLRGLENIVWEISNESHQESLEWQAHMVRFIKGVEAGEERPVWVSSTYPHVEDGLLFESPADVVSPAGRDYLDDPPPADGSKVVVVDTDHIAPWGADTRWVWRNFLRGNHFVCMDAYRDVRFELTDEELPDQQAMRRAMGHAVAWGRRVDLAAMEPRGELASTGYCLVNSGREYLVYLDGAGQVAVDLTGAHGRFSVEWFDTAEGVARDGRPADGGDEQTFRAPFKDALLYLSVSGAPST